MQLFLMEVYFHIENIVNLNFSSYCTICNIYITKWIRQFTIYFCNETVLYLRTCHHEANYLISLVNMVSNFLFMYSKGKDIMMKWSQNLKYAFFMKFCIRYRCFLFSSINMKRSNALISLMRKTCQWIWCLR